MRRNVIFDMDGVLIDSQPLHFRADLDVLSHVSAGKHKPSYNDVELMAGTPNNPRWQKYINMFDLTQSAETLIDMYYKAFTGLFRRGECKLCHGVAQLLALLRANGIKTAVATSTYMDLVSIIFDTLGLNGFDVMVTGEMVTNGKPEPDIFLKAAKELAANPADCLVVEDSYNGVKAAKAAGIYCVGYQNPTSGNQDLSAADMIISDFDTINNNLEWL
ncbi:MAG: HAD-IA family hydrolase [Clostridiales bacterium]|jgi:HAD superfamily hydrolase (TIGR01509 family)|nr:HAD-IA family hydrolase [Clostridiales bacterium]